MIRLTDKSKTVEITMCEWTGSGYTPDFSNDFFRIGGLQYNADLDAYIVPDVEYCAEQAEDWQLGRGDYADDAAACDISNRRVLVEYV